MKSPLHLKLFMPVALVWAAIFNANAQQDTVTITLSQAEQQFTSKNLQLLAEKYNIDIARAGEIQARLYNNPNFQVSSALYNQEQKKWLDVSNSTGQYSFGIQQLITLAGKRNKQIQLAQTNTRQAENSFFDLLRTLRYTLRSGFYNIYFLQHSVKAYAAQIATLERLDAAYSDLQTKGVVTLKDLVRIRSLLYSLKAEQTGLQNQLNDAEADFRLLMQNNKSWYVAQADSSLLNTNIDRLNLQQLTDSAIANRYDLKQAATALQYNQQNYSLQKALRVPDLSLGAEFDKRGSYINNASFLNAAIDLPFFNRNQGNIKAAKLGIEQSKLQLELQQSIVENDVQKAYAHLLTTQQMLKNIDPAFRNQFQQLMDGVTENFLKRNISLLDFTDFVESYKNNVLQLNQLQNDRMQAIEALNFSVGKTIVD